MIQVEFVIFGIDVVICVFVEVVYVQQIDFLCELVKVLLDNLFGDCVLYVVCVKVLLEVFGLMVEVYVVFQVQVCVVGMVSVINLIVWYSFGSGGFMIVMNVYGDVVLLGLGWMYDLYGGEIVEIEYGLIMFGCGVVVFKFDFVIYMWVLFVLIEVEKCGVEFNGMVELYFMYDEEIGGDIGLKWLLD